jgi:hypothetical protein
LNVETKHFVLEETVEKRFGMLEKCDGSLPNVNVNVMFCKFSAAYKVRGSTRNMEDVWKEEGSRTISAMPFKTDVASTDGSGGKVVFETFDEEGLNRLIVFEDVAVVEDVTVSCWIVIAYGAWKCALIE